LTQATIRFPGVRLTDKAYARLLDQLSGHNFDQIDPDLRANILAFYGDPNAPNAIKKKPADWQKTQDELVKLRALPAPAPAGSKAEGQVEPEAQPVEFFLGDPARTE